MIKWGLAFAWAIVSIVVLHSGGYAQASERRVALVIGNTAYQNLPRLIDATADAQIVARMLEKSGFAVTAKIDVSRRELHQLIDDFAAKIAASPDVVGLFYYAGHGVQTTGKNYLVPIDANLVTEADIDREAVDVGGVLRAVDEAHNRINIVILDACHDNPLPKLALAPRCFTPMPAPRGSLIFYAAAPGQTAENGQTGGNSVFATTLIKQIAVPGLPLDDVFKGVIGGVSAQTGGKQLPWMESTVQGNFFFVPDTTTTARPTPRSVAAQGVWLPEQQSLAPLRRTVLTPNPRIPPPPMRSPPTPRPPMPARAHLQHHRRTKDQRAPKSRCGSRSSVMGPSEITRNT